MERLTKISQKQIDNLKTITMTKDELLKPRYKVVATYPNSPYTIGDIINYADFSGSITSSSFCMTYDLYPAIFRKLEWWEEREDKDMPEYVSYVSLTLKERYGNDESKTRKYVQVTSWHKDKNDDWFFNKNPFNSLCSSFLPATKEEYESQNKKVNGNTFKNIS